MNIYQEFRPKYVSDILDKDNNNVNNKYGWNNKGDYTQSTTRINVLELQGQIEHSFLKSEGKVQDVSSIKTIFLQIEH